MPEEEKPKQPEDKKEGLQPVLQPQQPQQLLNREQLEALRNKLQKKFH